MCDDCSTDGTWNILLDYSRSNDRIRVFRNDKNLGFKMNFEKAISLCNGKYIALSDQDDIWSEMHIEYLLNSIGDKVLACGNSLLTDKYGNSLNLTLREQESLDYIPEDDFNKLKSILLFRNPYQGSTMLLKRELVSFVLPFPDSVNYHDTWIASVACVTGGLVYVNEILLKYRRTDSSVTGHREKRKSKLNSFLHAWLFSDRIGLIDELLTRAFPLPEYKRKQLMSYKRLIINNTLIRKPITVLHLLMDYKNIYSCDKLHWF